MYAPKIERYLRLQSFHPAVRTWIRFWLDGLHDGTHVHWQLSPLSVLSFGKLAPFLQPLDTWRSHLQAMIRMANRRRALNGYFGAMPASTDEMQWVSFFGDQKRNTDELLKDLADWHLKWITAGDISTSSLEALWPKINELAALLILRGYSTDDLFNRVKDGVIDPDTARVEPRRNGFKVFLSTSLMLNKGSIGCGQTSSPTCH